LSRLFIAVELPERLRERLAKIQGMIRPVLASVRWVPPDNIHLTLKFLGNVEPDKIELIGEALSRLAADRAPFAAAAEGIGAFPDLRRPRVIWAGAASGAERLQGLAEDVEAKMFNLGFPRENRDFSSHLTIGRFNRPTAIRGLDAILEKAGKEELGSFPVDVITLFQSELAPQGARYRSLGRYPLRGETVGNR